jgi:hypothetical protein
MGYESPGFRTRVLAFVLVFVIVSIIWGCGDLFRYFILGGEPSVKEIPWLVGGFMVVWIIGDLWDHFHWTHERRTKIEARLDALERRGSNSD